MYNIDKINSIDLKYNSNEYYKFNTNLKLLFVRLENENVDFLKKWFQTLLKTITFTVYQKLY